MVQLFSRINVHVCKFRRILSKSIESHRDFEISIVLIHEVLFLLFGQIYGRKYLHFGMAQFFFRASPEIYK